MSALGITLICVCGLIVTVVLLLSVGPTSFLVGLLAAALPALPLVGVYLWLDRHEPEPLGMLLFAFGWGATVATAGALLLSLPPTLVVAAAGGDPETFGAVVVAPVVEESFKALGVLAIVLVGRRELDGLVDGFVYAGLVGVGFAFTENILYLGSALLDSGPGGLLGTFLLRGVVSPFAHPLFTAAFGIALVLGSRRRGAARYGLPLLGLGAAMGLHALWNGMAVGPFMGFAGTFVLLWPPTFLTFVAVAVIARQREARMIRQNVTFYARNGFLTPAEALMLQSLPSRRDAVRRAAATGGPRAARATARFQVMAVRLAHLRQRILAGTAPVDVRVREQHLLDGLMAMRRGA